MYGYSDRLHHALAFAAKHYDREVHKGTRSPSGTHAPMVALILARYGQPDATVIAGALVEVVADAVRERQSRTTIDQRMSLKFGADTIDTLLEITPRAVDDAGFEFSHDERRADLLHRLGTAGDPARWICAADTLFEVGSTLANLRRTIDAESVWSSLPLGRAGSVAWYRRLHERLASLGFSAAIMDELQTAIAELDRLAGQGG
jgi:hypothetical protein